MGINLLLKQPKVMLCEISSLYDSYPWVFLHSYMQLTFEVKTLSDNIISVKTI